MLGFHQSERKKLWQLYNMSLAKALMLSNCDTEEDSRVPRTARWSNQSILQKIIPEYSLEGLILKLKLPIFCHLMGKADSLEKTLMLGEIEGRRGDDRGWDGRMASPTRWRWAWASSQSWWCREAWCAAVHGVAKRQTRLSDWTTATQARTSETTRNSLWNVSYLRKQLCISLLPLIYSASFFGPFAFMQFTLQRSWTEETLPQGCD